MKFHTNMSVENYRGAVYFTTIARLRTFFKGFLFFLAFAILYLILGQAGVIPYSHIINFIVTAYLVFMLFQFGRVELAIYRYSKQPNTIIGMDIIYSFYNNYFTIEIPSLKEKNNYGIETIMEAVEISSNFILYMNQTQTFIIPKTGMSAEQLSFLRTYLLQNLKSRFSSTVIDRANKAMNAPKKKNLFGKF